MPFAQTHASNRLRVASLSLVSLALRCRALQTVCSNLRLRFRSAAGVVIPVLIAAAVDLVYTGKPSVATFVMFGVAYGESLA